MSRERSLTREEAKLVTRHRLIQAGVALLSEGGMESLTTGRVAQRAGVAQPTFYVHFRDMSALLQALGDEQIGKLRETLRTLRSQLRNDTPPHLDIIRETFRLPLQRISEQQGSTLRLFISEMHKPHSLLGQMGRQLMDGIIQDLVDDLTALGLTGQLTPVQLQMACDGIIFLTMHFGQSLLDGRYQDQEAVVDLLTRMMLSVLF